MLAAVLTAAARAPVPLRCLDRTSVSLDVQVGPLPPALGRIDLVAVELHLSATPLPSEKAYHLVTAPVDGPSGTARLVLRDLLPDRVYHLRPRVHPASAPSIVQGWVNATRGETRGCSTAAGGTFGLRRVGSAPEARRVRVEWDGGVGEVVRRRAGGGWRPAEMAAGAVVGLEPGLEYELAVRVGDAVGDPVLFRTARVGAVYTEMFRVSEYTYEVDFLPNHNSASFEAQAAFLTSTNDNLFFQLARSPVTRYCVEHLDPTPRGFAPYVSCNGPEADPRNSPADPICICDVWADRMIALQPRSEFLAACGPVTWRPDGTHTNPDCNCTGPDGSRSKWQTSEESQRFVGMMPAYMPYFYFQLPAQSYNGTRRIGENWSTPRRGQCNETQALGDGGCTWRRLPAASVVMGQQLLDLGWNNTAVQHWPLHRHGPNQTDQYLNNLAVFRKGWAALDARLSPRCCGC